MARQLLDASGKVIERTQTFIPTITLWNRLEGRPRTENFERALKAEIRDPLWMLSKQWQTGEFKGEDAGSAILAKVHMKTTALNKYRAGENVSPFDDTVPLEVKVEHQEIPFQLGNQEISIDLRLIMGRQWLKLLKKEGLDFKNQFLEKYSFVLPQADKTEDAPYCAHPEVWQQLAAISNILKEADDTHPAPELRPELHFRNCMDGYSLYSYLSANSLHHAYDNIDGVATDAIRDEIDALATRFTRWFEKLYYQPIEVENASWKSSYLEYQFACSAPVGDQEKVFTADEYYHGHLDWYNLDIHNEQTSLPEPAVPNASDEVQDSFTLSFIPSPVSFGGMPHNRWWTLEDWKTDLGGIKPSTTDINQLMVLDFGLNYANDWFMLPHTLPVGSIANVEGLMVTNVFGEQIWVEAAGSGDDQEWDRWSMFHLNTRGTMEVPADLSLLLLPSLPKGQEGKSLEEIFMLRDEVANMVWGVESQVPLATGKSKRGKEVGIELRTKLQQFIAISEDDDGSLASNEAKIRYQLVNSVPEHWIPFIPVHKDEDKREIQLQRATMPRILKGMAEGEAPKKIEPRTSILREGLDKSTSIPYFIHEEEIPKAGIRVTKAFQRTRWMNGDVFNWVGFKKQVGRGEGRSGLAFDQIIPTNSSEAE